MPTRSPTDVSHYTYRVTWSAEDQEFVATCMEFPSLSWLAPSQIQALTGLEDLIGETVDDMRRQDEPVPEPSSSFCCWSPKRRSVAGQRGWTTEPQPGLTGGIPANLVRCSTRVRTR